MLGKILKQWLLAAVRVLALASMLTTVLASLRTVRRTRAILLYPDYGFGHTISGPDWLRLLHPGEPSLTFFRTSHDRSRHNPLIRDLWGADRFIWIRIGVVLPRFGAVYDPAWSTRLFQALRRFLAWYVPKTPCYFWVDGLVAATARPAWLPLDNPFNSRYESRYYPLMERTPACALHVSDLLRCRVSKALKSKFGSDFPRRCAFYVRYRGFASEQDTSSINRMSPELDAYLPAFGVLNRAGYQILLTGDATVPPGMIAAMGGGLVDWRGAGVDEDAYRLFAGTEVDVHIGSLSGGSAFLLATDMAGLMLNAFAPGDALPKTTVSYKWLIHADGTLVGLEDLLSGKFYDHQLHDCRMIDNSPEEMAEIVGDFIRHLGERPYGIDPADLAINAAWIRAADARVSPVWLRQYGSRLRTARVPLLVN